LQRIALAPVELARGAGRYLTRQVALERENQALRERELADAERLMAFEALAAENAQLRRLLEARERLPRKSIFAEILYSGRDPFSRKVVIDKGGRDGIRPGEAVVDDIGVIGQVTRVYPMLAEVTLVTDKDQAVPVQVVRNGLRAVIYGSADGASLDLRFMAANADIQAGDVLVTSGIDGTYPEGLPVARVTRVEREAGYAFARIVCAPLAGPGQHRQVLVLSPPQAAPAPPPEPAAEPRAKRARPR
jgi:rod shape-determining protein MreC